MKVIVSPSKIAQYYEVTISKKSIQIVNIKLFTHIQEIYAFYHTAIRNYKYKEGT